MSRKTCLITGATSGIGRATAFELGRRGWDLWLVGRDTRRGEGVVRDLSRLGGGGRARFYQTDISSLRGVRALVEKVREDTPRLDVLINNAGARILSPGRSADGVELTFAGNHLGHFLLTLLMIDLLSRSDSGRVVNVASSAHHGGRGDFATVLGGGPYDGRKAYAESKLANVLFTRELSRRLEGTSIRVNAVDPGEVATRFSRNNGLLRWLWHCLYYAKQRSLLTPAQGCRTVVYLASSEDLAGISGEYYHDRKLASTSVLAQDKALAVRLWDLSITLAGVNMSDLSASFREQMEVKGFALGVPSPARTGGSDIVKGDS